MSLQLEGGKIQWGQEYYIIPFSIPSIMSYIPWKLNTDDDMMMMMVMVMIKW